MADKGLEVVKIYDAAGRPRIFQVSDFPDLGLLVHEITPGEPIPLTEQDLEAVANVLKERRFHGRS